MASSIATPQDGLPSWAQPNPCSRRYRESAELGFVAFRAERVEPALVTEVHRPPGRPPAGQAVTARASQRMAADSERLIDSPSKPLGAPARLRPAALVAAPAAGVHSGSLRRPGRVSDRGLVSCRDLCCALSLDFGTNQQLVLDAVSAEGERLATVEGASVKHRHETGVVTLSEHNRSARYERVPYPPRTDVLHRRAEAMSQSPPSAKWSKGTIEPAAHQRWRNPRRKNARQGPTGNSGLALLLTA